MKNYYLYQGDQRQGPYSIDQLKEMQISPIVPVWTEGLATWTEAQQIPELQAALFATPPPYIPAYPGRGNEYESSATERVGFTMGRYWKGILAGLLVAAVVFLVIKVVNSGGDTPPAASDMTAASYIQASPAPRPKTEAELKEELRQTEMQNPEKYISTDITWRKNLVGETVIEGTLTNKASVAAFKDPVLRVTWWSKTNTPMRVSTYPVYEYIGARQSVPCKLKVHGPRKAENVGVTVESATAVE
ncbi:MAG: DUF4339 domain-containing protein [Chitinophagaceae bacterium]